MDGCRLYWLTFVLLAGWQWLFRDRLLLGLRCAYRSRLFLSNFRWSPKPRCLRDSGCFQKVSLEEATSLPRRPVSGCLFRLFRRIHFVLRCHQLIRRRHKKCLRASSIHGPHLRNVSILLHISHKRNHWPSDWHCSSSLCRAHHHWKKSAAWLPATSLSIFDDHCAVHCIFLQLWSNTQPSSRHQPSFVYILLRLEF